MQEAEEALSKVNHQLESMIKSITDGLLVLDKNWRYTYVSETAGKILGMNPKDLIGGCVWELFPAAINSKFYTGYHQAVETGKPVYIEEYYPEPLNMWLSAACYPSIDGLTVYFQDVTKRKKAEEAFLKSKELIEAQRKRLETILETSPSAIVILEAPNGKISYINKRALELYGFDTVKLNLLEHIAAVKARKLNGSEYPAWEVPAAKALKGQVVRNEELIIKQANGKEIPVVVSAAPIYNKDNVASAIAIFEDITERKKTEQVLRKSEEKIKEYANNLEKIVAERTKELKESERLAAIGATAGMVGHDIRNPLQAIVGDIYLLSDVLLDLPEGKMKKEVRESLENIGANINYINKIVADLQDYARPITPEIKTLNLYELVTTCFGPIEIPDEIKIYLDIDVSLWLRTDETLLRRIISNLVTNAIQAMPNGGSLSIKASQSEDGILVTVEDSGMGIPESFKSKLFTPMMTTKSKGQGLGLAVVKRLVEVLKGTVSFESQEGKGTKFIIKLPA